MQQTITHSKKKKSKDMEITRLRKGAAKKRRTRSFFQVQSKKHADDQNISRKKPTPSECNEISPI